jgi:hypothetical protein
MYYRKPWIKIALTENLENRVHNSTKRISVIKSEDTINLIDKVGVYREFCE